MENLDIYEKVRAVPESAQKRITGGKLNGFTDINPMWRIKVLTELFGVVGFGWYVELVKQWVEPGPEGRIAAFCNINLYIKQGTEWGKPINATGGSMLTDIEKEKLVTSDECYKMAYTDALSVACKMLGVGADVYWQKDRTKYDRASGNEAPPQKAADPPRDFISQIPMKCADCDEEITDRVHDFSISKHGRPLCMKCQKKA